MIPILRITVSRAKRIPPARASRVRSAWKRASTGWPDFPGKQRKNQTVRRTLRCGEEPTLQQTMWHIQICARHLVAGTPSAIRPLFSSWSVRDWRWVYRIKSSPVPHDQGKTRAWSQVGQVAEKIPRDVTSVLHQFFFGPSRKKLAGCVPFATFHDLVATCGMLCINAVSTLQGKLPRKSPVRSFINSLQLLVTQPVTSKWDDGILCIINVPWCCWNMTWSLQLVNVEKQLAEKSKIFLQLVTQRCWACRCNGPFCTLPLIFKRALCDRGGQKIPGKNCPRGHGVPVQNVWQTVWEGKQNEPALSPHNKPIPRQTENRLV